MGGRGRGRGRGAVPPSVASAPFGAGSPSSTTSGIYNSRTEPSQKYPDILIPEAPNFDNFTEFQLKSAEFSDKIDSLLKNSASFRPIKTTQQKIDRYSDKYLSHVSKGNDQRDRLSTLQSSLEFFPDELHSVYQQQQQNDPNTSKRKKSSVSSTVSFKDTLNHLESLAQKEESNNENEKSDAEDDDVVGAEEVDEEIEDETDYNYSYFDNGEDLGDYDDANDEAVF